MPSRRPVNIEGSTDSPKILLDIEKKLFLIEGSSYPEDAYIIYESILDWLKAKDVPYNGQLNCDFRFNVLSSASRKMVYEILLELEKAHEEQGDIVVNWHYETYDEDMMEVGEDFAEVLNLPFNLLPF